MENQADGLFVKYFFDIKFGGSDSDPSGIISVATINLTRKMLSIAIVIVTRIYV